MKSITYTLEPGEFAAAFAANFNTGDLEIVLAGYAPDAVLSLGSGGTFREPREIRKPLESFLAPGLPIATTPIHSQTTGDTAVVIFDWLIDGKAPDGTAVRMGGRAVDVLRRNAQGHWMQLLDLPFGAATPVVTADSPTASKPG